MWSIFVLITNTTVILVLSSVDVDECSFEEQCRRELGNVCVNTPGSYICQCQQGFRAQAPACVGKSVVKLHRGL